MKVQIKQKSLNKGMQVEDSTVISSLPDREKADFLASG